VPEFKPVLYLKLSCPFCLKVAAYLSEAGVFDRFELRAFWPDDGNEAAIRNELAPHLEKVTFPALQFAPGEFVADSDAIIERYRSETGADPAELPFYNYVLNGAFRRLRENFQEIRQLQEKLSDAG